MNQTAFMPPPMSRRRKRSAKTLNRSQIQMKNRKKRHIDQKTSRNG